MAGTTTNLTTGQRSTGRVTLTATQMDTVNAPAQWTKARILWDGTGWGFVRGDGQNVSLDDKAAYPLPPFPCELTIDVGTKGSTVITVIGTAGSVYVVTGEIGR